MNRGKVVSILVCILLVPAFLFGETNLSETTISVNSGTPIDVRVVEDIHPAKMKAGDRILLVVDKDVVVNGYVVISNGARVIAEVAESK